MEMLGGGGGVSAQCRTPDIMADAAYIMLTRDARSFTGNFVIGIFHISIVSSFDLKGYMFLQHLKSNSI